jgi:hypothetical protein
MGRLRAQIQKSRQSIRYRADTMHPEDYLWRPACLTAKTGSCAAQEKREMFAKNVGNADRIMRIMLGIVLIALVFVGPKTPWGWIGIVPLLTGLFSACPVYALFGIRTCAKK